MTNPSHLKSISDSTPIDELEIHVDVAFPLIRHGVSTVGDLRRLGVKGLLAVPRIGPERIRCLLHLFRKTPPGAIMLRGSDTSTIPHKGKVK